jgi:peptide-methionine (S)-S-oxide reductase
MAVSTRPDVRRSARFPSSSVCAGYYAGNYQQYLAKNPFGYRCHANTGMKFPETA